MEVLGVEMSEEVVAQAKLEHDKVMAMIKAERLQFITRMSDLTWGDVQGNLEEAYNRSLTIEERAVHAWTYVAWNKLFNQDVQSEGLEMRDMLGLIYSKTDIIYMCATILKPQVSVELYKGFVGTAFEDKYALFCLHIELERVIKKAR